MDKNGKLLILLIFSQFTYCQLDLPNYSNSAINYEAFGHTTHSIISLNYERYFYTSNDNIQMTLRTGFGIEPGYNAINGERLNQVTTIPSVLTLLIGKRFNYFQFGIGYKMAFATGLVDDTVVPVENYPRFSTDYSVSLGYRFMTGNLVLQAYPTLVRKNDLNAKIELSFGMSIGRKF